jgi:hypothetical protein
MESLLPSGKEKAMKVYVACDVYRRETALMELFVSAEYLVNNYPSPILVRLLNASCVDVEDVGVSKLKTVVLFDYYILFSF